MTDFVTADLHFSHTNIIKFCPVTRYGMKDADHMNSILVAEWNRDVQPEDTVYILGDVAFGRVERATAILQGLNGRKILIAGNHDHKNLRDPAFRACFDEVHPYYEMTYNGTFVVMFHYPIHEWNQMHAVLCTCTVTFTAARLEWNSIVFAMLHLTQLVK